MGLSHGHGQEGARRGIPAAGPWLGRPVAQTTPWSRAQPWGLPWRASAGVRNVGGDSSVGTSPGHAGWSKEACAVPRRLETGCVLQGARTGIRTVFMPRTK